jgi:ABC-type transport system involved in multi-copper enzyme maturation permease subunit
MLSAYFFTTPRYMDMPLFVAFCWLSAVSIALLTLSYFLRRGRSWALSTLVVLCWLLAFSIVAFFFAGMLSDRVHTSDIIGAVGETIAMASPPLWFSVMLRQPDIVRAFSPTRHIANTSNKSLDPTAGRRDD